MPTVEVTRGRTVKPIAPGTTQISPGAFGAESQATARLAREIGAFGATVAGAIRKAESLRAARDIQQGTDAYEKMLDENALWQTTEKDYTQWAPHFLAAHDKKAEEISDGMSPLALQSFKPYMDRQRQANHTTIQVDAHRQGAREWTAGLPTETQQNADMWIVDPEGADRRWEDNLNIWDSAGLLTKDGPGSREGLNRARVMVKAQTYAQRYPELAAAYLKDNDQKKNKDAMLDTGLFTKADLKLLSSTDMEALQQDARQNLKFRQAQVKAVEVQAQEELEREQTEKLNEAYEFAAVGKLKPAIDTILASKHGGEWKNKAINILEDTVTSIEKGGKNFFEDDGSDAKKAELTTKAMQGRLTLGELDEWHGRKDGISTATYKSLAGEIGKGDDELSVGLKQRFTDLESLLSVETETPAKEKISDKRLTRLGITGERGIRLAKAGGITSKQYQDGNQALWNAYRQDPTIATDSTKLETVWNDVVLPAMFSTVDQETGGSFWDRFRWLGVPAITTAAGTGGSMLETARLGKAVIGGVRAGKAARPKREALLGQEEAQEMTDEELRAIAGAK
jgi:hypothetical protein